MFTLGTAAYKLYSASSQVGSTLSTLSNYHKYVTEAIFNSPSEVANLHPLVKQNLDRLARRIQVLSSPLNYCLLWSQHRGSAVAETIHQCKEVLKQTYHWLHKCNKDKSKLSDKEYMLKKLDEHIREIDFCLQSLNLALSIIQTTDSIMPSNKDIESISPSSLLTASNRIMAMHNSGGDVSICFGQLFKRSVLQNTGWQRIYRRSALKIYRNGVRKFYELRIESNEYGYDSDDNMDTLKQGTMNEAHPLALKFDLTQSIYFTTLSSLLIDLPNYNNYTNINIQNLHKHDLIEDAFGWLKMLANQVQEQYIFVLKSGLDDWDKPLSSTDDDESQAPNTSHRIVQKDIQKQESQHDHEELDYHLTASIASLDTAVQQARHRTHLGSLLAPGGDYDESHITPQLMAYMTRLAIYENDYTKPHTVHHTNSTFKKYTNDHKLSTSLIKEESNASSHTSSSNTSNTSNASSQTVINESEYDGISNDEYKIKQQQKIPAHLNASDEELYLFLRNPPTLPIPFYPKNIRFADRNSGSARTYRRRNRGRRSRNRSDDKERAYFAAPHNHEVTVTYPNNCYNNDNDIDNDRQKNDNADIINDENLSLSISDENHMKYIDKKEDKPTVDLTPKTKQSMAAIKDATNSSLLQNVELTASQSVSTLNSPRSEQNKHGDDDEHMLSGNFANLSIDNDNDNDLY